MVSPYPVMSSRFSYLATCEVSQASAFHNYWVSNHTYLLFQ